MRLSLQISQKTNLHLLFDLFISFFHFNALYLVKSCEGSEILCSLQANNLACYSFLDASRISESSGWKDCITHGMGFLCGSAGKESACNAGDLGLIHGLGTSLGDGKGYPLQYSGLENSMQCTVHGVAKSRIWLSDFHFHFFIARSTSFLFTAFLMMYSTYKLNKQGDNIQPWHTPFPIWNQSVVPCPVLTVASWPAYRFLKRQVRYQ